MATGTAVSNQEPTDAGEDRNHFPGSLTTTVNPPRSLDTFLDKASHDSDEIKPRFWLIFFSLGMANSSDASEILCLSYILSEESFEENILQHRPWRAGLLAAAVFLGMLIGGLLVGSLGDLHGRHSMLKIGLLINSISGLLSSLAPDSLTLSLLRFCSGLGIGATVPPLFTLCSELSPPTSRGFWVTFTASFWMVGSIYVALMGWVLLATWNTSWRLFAMACAIPSALGYLLVTNYVPESPRFLALQGHTEQAVVVANRLAANMKYLGRDWTSRECMHYYPPKTANLQARRHGSLVQMALVDFCRSSSQLYTQSIRRTTLPLQLVWFSLSFGSYGLLTWINTLFFAVHLKNVYFNALLFAFSNLPGNILAAYGMDRFGRTQLLIGSVMAAALSLLAFAYMAGQEESTLPRNWIVVAACFFQCFTISAWNSIDVLTSEMFPTSVRSTGLGVCAASGRIGAMLAQFVNGVLVTYPVRLLLVAAVTLLLGGLTPMMLPDDKTGQAMEDTVSDVNRHTFSYNPVQSREPSQHHLYNIV